MKLYPAIDLKDGATVQLVGGDPSRVATQDDDPVQVATKWVEEGASALHIVDLDAALGRGSNEWIVERILQTLPQPVQLGGGIRHLVDIQKRLEMGVGRVIIGTQGVKHPEWLAEACKIFPGKIMLAVDARGDEVAVSGWQEGSGLKMDDVLRRVADMDLAGVLYTNIDVEGQMTGVDRAAVENVVANTSHPVVASGGIGTMDDLDTLKELDIEGAVLGMSIYTGKIPLRKAIEHIEERKVPKGRAVLIPKSEVQWGDLPEDVPEDRVLRVPDLSDNGGRSRDTDDTGTIAADESPLPAARAPKSLWGRRKKTGDEDDHVSDAEAEDTAYDDDDDHAEVDA